MPRAGCAFPFSFKLGDQPRHVHSTVSANWPITIDLTSLTRHPAHKESIRDESPQNHKEQRQHLHRHRWLDLRAMARRVLSGKARASQRVVVCRLEADLDRDQRHLLRLAEAGEFSQM